MNHEPILEALAARPGMRSVDLADKLDRDTVEVEGALLALIKIGHVEVGEGTGANGKPTVVYNLTDTYLASDEAAHLRSKALVANFRVDGWETMSRAQKALAYARSRPNETATAAELHVVMGLPPEVYVSVALSHCITSGAFVRDGKNWTVGKGKLGDPAATSAASDAVTSMASKAAPAEEPAPAAVAEQPSKPARELVPGYPANLQPAPALIAEDADVAVLEEPMVELQGAVLNPAILSTGQLAEAYSAIAGEMGKRDLSAAMGSATAEWSRCMPVDPPFSARAAAVPHVFDDQVAKVDPADWDTNTPSTRFAIWSDGTFEVQRNGLTALVLSDAELGDMLGFIAGARGAA